MKIPSFSEIEQLRRKCETPEPVILHMEAVSRFLDSLLDRLEEAGCFYDREPLRAAALLHDLCRLKPDHAAAGAAFLWENGFPEIAALVENHHAPADTVPKTAEVSFAPSPSDLLFYADKRVQGDLVVSLEERFAASRGKCRTKEALDSHQGQFSRAQAIEKQLRNILENLPQGMLSLHPGGMRLTMEAAKEAALRPGERLLDIGCGSGCSLALLKDRFGILPYGIDCSSETLSIAAKTVPDAVLCKGDACALPYPGAFFDAVLMECVLTLLDDPEAALREAARVLKTGGRLLLSTLCRRSDTFFETAGSPPDSRSGEDTPPPSPYAPVCTGGLADPEALLRFAESLSFRVLKAADRKKELTDYMIESIMQYGSLEERISAETALTGSSVFDCRCRFDPENISYCLFVFQKS